MFTVEKFTNRVKQIYNFEKKVNVAQSNFIHSMLGIAVVNRLARIVVVILPQ